MGHFLVFTDHHSSLVANVKNLKTGCVSPQFHLVFDDLFQTFLVQVTMTWLLMLFIVNCLKVIRISVLRMNSVWMGN